MAETIKDTNKHWRTRSAVSVAEAAAILGKSTSWVRDRLTDCSLERVALLETKCIAITIGSVVQMAERLAALRTAHTASGRTAERPWLRLVVDNDPK